MDLKFDVCLKFHACKNLNFFSQTIENIHVFHKTSSQKKHTKKLAKSSRFVSSIHFENGMISDMSEKGFLAPKIWDILPKEIKDSESLDISKETSKNGLHGNALADFAKHM